MTILKLNISLQQSQTPERKTKTKSSTKLFLRIILWQGYLFYLVEPTQNVFVLSDPYFTYGRDSPQLKKKNEKSHFKVSVEEKEYIFLQEKVVIHGGKGAEWVHTGCLSGVQVEEWGEDHYLSSGAWTILPYFSDCLNVGNELLSFLKKCIFVGYPVCQTSGWAERENEQD